MLLLKGWRQDTKSTCQSDCSRTRARSGKGPLRRDLVNSSPGQSCCPTRRKRGADRLGGRGGSEQMALFLRGRLPVWCFMASGAVYLSLSGAVCRLGGRCGMSVMLSGDGRTVTERAISRPPASVAARRGGTWPASHPAPRREFLPFSAGRPGLGGDATSPGPPARSAGRHHVSLSISGPAPRSGPIRSSEHAPRPGTSDAAPVSIGSRE